MVDNYVGLYRRFVPVAPALRAAQHNPAILE